MSCSHFSLLISMQLTSISPLGSSSSFARREQAVLEFLPSSKAVSASGLVTSVAWSVSPTGGARLLPRELGNLEELVFCS